VIALSFTETIPRGLCLALGANVVIVGAIATSVTLMLYSKRAADFISKRFKLSEAARGDLSDATEKSLTVRKGAVWCTAGRLVQLVQYGICVVAIGGTSGVVQASLAHGTQLIGASIGDVIPGQVGAVETAYTTFADAIHLTPERVLALPLLIRVTQLSLAVTCLIVATAMGRKKPITSADTPATPA